MRLTKHQGLGNDFLVWLDLDSSAADLAPADVADLARAACERRRGVGADGLLHVTAPDGAAAGADVVMALFNADGGRAEMSGNGIACLAQGALVAGVAGPGRVDVATDAGLRSVEVVAEEAARRHRMRVDMGPATIDDRVAGWADDGVLATLAVDVGNPHVVLRVEEPDKFPIEEVGRRICEATPRGVNVEAVAPVEGGLVIVVYERGVGVTEACGTGACAAAAAAFRWGLIGERVAVDMPGGSADVELGPTIRLTTTVVHVATVDFHWP
jgi:diaminopimelate epimerase